MTENREQDQINGHDAEILTDEDNRSLALPGLVLPTHLYLLPLNNRPVFPGQIQPIVVNAERWGSTIAKIGETGHQSCGLVYVGEIPAEQVGPDEFATIGCLTKLHKLVQ
jgi:ATP-dependent Lon protease